MRCGTAIKEIMKLRNYTFKVLAERSGYKSPSNVIDRLRRGNMKTDTLLKLAEGLDCEVVIRSKLKDKTEWVVTAEDIEK